MLKKSYSKEDFERMDYLRMEEERIKKFFILDNLPVGIVYMVNESITIIKKIVKNDLEDIEKMSLPELFCYAEVILEKELNES